MPSACPHESELAAFASGALGCEERRALEVHLDSCSTCREVCSIAAEPDEHPDESSPQPRRLGRFTLERLLGAGGLGVVWLAWDPELQRHVAIKILRERSDDERGRMLREARAMARVAHPNIVAIYEVGQVDGRVFLAMEYVEGTTLRQWLAQAPRPWRAVLEACIACGAGLAAAHARNLIHRDFKPDNVLRGSDAGIKVCDFGLASEVDVASTWPDARAPVATTGGGTLGYVAPERLRGAHADARSDLFSFCVTAYEALYGQRPFGGLSAADMLTSIDAGIPSLPVRDPSRRVPLRVHRILARGLSADPSQRPSSMADLLRELERAIGSRRRGMALGAFAVCAVSGVVALETRGSDARCHEAAAELDAIWNDERREQVARVFASSGEPYAEDTWRSAERELARYAESWRTARIATCEMQRERDGAAEPYVLRRLCLDARRTALSTAIDVLTDAERAPIADAVSLAERLPPIRACATLIEPATPPSEDELARLREADDLLARATALRSAGQEREALELSEQAVIAAQAAAPDRLAKAHLLRADLARASDLELAREALDAGLVAALEAKDSSLLAQTSLHWCRLTAGGGELDEARRWLRRAEGAIAGIVPDDVLLANLDNARFGVAEAAGDVEGMRTAAQRSLTSVERARGARSLDAALAHHNLALSHFRGGALEEAHQHATIALEIVREQLGSHHPKVAIFSVLQGFTLFHSGRTEEATEVFEQALTLAQRTLGSGHTKTLELMDGLGHAHLRAGRYEAAADLFRRELQGHAENGGATSLDVATAKGNLGYALTLMGALDEADPVLRDARELMADKLGRDHPRVAYATVLLSDVRLEQGEAAEVVDELEHAVQILERGGFERGDLAQARFALAKASWAVGRGRARARSLAQQARADYATMPAASGSIARVDAWLQATSR